MTKCENFISSILPGNYALTKSMELTKVQSSGTLWYTKKFLVLYYYVFLSNEIMSRQYIAKVISYFDAYINSVPENLRDSAEKFFYPDDPSINFKSDKFKSFLSFAAITDFSSNEERREYYQNAKKFYFSLLMNSGGQTGVKKLMKESMQTAEFIYSSPAIQNILKNAAISSLIEDVNSDQKVHDRSIKYILSEEAIKRITELSMLKEVTYNEASNIVTAYPADRPKYKAIENDVVAFIRNERQIMYYYGYFHSKSSGANDVEFSSLTPVGEMAMIANSYEFLAIWEHQKIKMISQPATADINDVKFCENDVSKFSISYSPYLDILASLKANSFFSLEQYKYVLSRKKSIIKEEDWIEIESEAFQNIDRIKSLVASFGRRGDVRDEDFRKELLKYILGLRSDLAVDQGENILGCLTFSNGKVSISSDRRMSFLTDLYSSLNSYKLQRYLPLFERCETDLAARYRSYCRHTQDSSLPEPQIDPKVKIDWDLYNIHIDKFIYLGTLFAIAFQCLHLDSIESLTKENISDILVFYRDNFDATLKLLGIRGVGALKIIIEKFVSAIRNNDFSAFILDEPEKAEILAEYKHDSLKGLYKKIIDISQGAKVRFEEGRIRNSTLVSLMKSYYLQMFGENSVLKCECCGEDTFITQVGEPYVEFHHLIPFNIAFGPDHYLNLFALCPNCHRKMHFLNLSDKEDLYKFLNANNYMKISLIERLRSLKSDNLLRSYHLEYLLAEKAITSNEYDSIAS